MNATAPIFGLLGGIGSGKSAVAELLVARGGILVAGDPIGHMALRQADIQARIAQRWGSRVLADDGTIDRKKLGAIVFASPVERANLEYLVFPFIKQQMREQIAAAQANPACRFVVVDAAVMLEAGWTEPFDVLIYVDVPDAVREERVCRTRGWSAEDLHRREAAQMPLAVKRRRADVILDNAGSPEALAHQVDAFLAARGLARCA